MADNDSEQHVPEESNELRTKRRGKHASNAWRLTPRTNVLLVVTTACLIVLIRPELLKQLAAIISNQRCFQKEPGVRTISGSYSAIKALELLYGKYDPNLHGVPRKDSELPADRVGEVPDSGVTRVVLSQEYDDEGKTRHLLITDTEAKGFDCHACAPLVSAAVFVKAGDQWNLEHEFPSLDVSGKFGKPASMRWLKVGSGYALQVELTDGDQGYFTTDIALLSLGQGSPKYILQTENEFADGEKLYVDLKFQRSEKPYWDAQLKVTRNGGNPVTTDYVYHDGAYAAMK